LIPLFDDMQQFVRCWDSPPVEHAQSSISIAAYLSESVQSIYMHSSSESLYSALSFSFVLTKFWRLLISVERPEQFEQSLWAVYRIDTQ
jgi:hypothetical protein